MADEDRILESQRPHDVPGVQGVVEHVAKVRAVLGFAIARQVGRIDVMRRRQRLQNRIVRPHAAGAVQIDEGVAGPAFEVANLGVRRGQGLEAHASGSSGGLGDARRVGRG
jgi:hypothetical protein